MIAEKDVVYKTFPTPLINRMEKHIVVTERILDEQQLELLEKLNTWIKEFSHYQHLE